MLTSCDYGEDASALDYPAKIHARSVNPEIYSEYLGCYAFNLEAKEKCTDLLAKKYLPKRKRKHIPYQEAFQFEAEKLGFKKFINDFDLPCRKVAEDPEFVEAKHAYLIKCVGNKGVYWMQFNYETKEWKLIK